jgi:hypothetical protein
LLIYLFIYLFRQFIYLYLFQVSIYSIYLFMYQVYLPDREQVEKKRKLSKKSADNDGSELVKKRSKKRRLLETGG